jgi:Iap family predicted aminopeptidase
VEVKLKFEGDHAFDYVEDQLDIGFRIPGTDESEECVEYFVSKFKEIDNNISYIVQDFEIHSTDCQNILFKINENEEDIVILGAHYDSRAKATKDEHNKGESVPGANDGASGCAVLIELAEVLFEKKQDLDCQLWFLFFDAEDQGKDEGGYGIDGWEWAEGSKEFVDNLDDFYDSDDEDIECMILLDMVGGENLQFINEQYSTFSLLDEIFQIGRNLGFLNEFPIFPIISSVYDDHVAFIESDIPSADLIIKFWDNLYWPYHHTREDDISHISKTSLEITGKVIEQFIYNNYLDDVDEDYFGNHPWEDDINLPNSEILLFLFCIILIGTVFPVAYYIHQKSLNKERSIKIHIFKF